MVSIKTKRFANAAVALGASGVIAAISMPSAFAATQEIHVSPGSGAPGTSVAITVTNCNKVNVTFTDGSVNTIVPGNVTGISQNPNLPMGNFIGSYVIPANTPAGPAQVRRCRPHAAPVCRARHIRRALR